MRPTDIRHLLFLAAVALAQPIDARILKGGTPMPADTAARPDKMQPVPVPPANSRAATPGTQNEDTLHVGIKRSAGGDRTPVAGARPLPSTGAKPLTPQGPLAAPAVAPRPGAGSSPNVANRKARSGGDDDLDELEVERRKAPNAPQVGTGAPLPRPGAGTSPNTGSGARTAPSGPFK
jgi:hypothetical protein